MPSERWLGIDPSLSGITGWCIMEDNQVKCCGHWKPYLKWGEKADPLKVAEKLFNELNALISLPKVRVGVETPIFMHSAGTAIRHSLMVGALCGRLEQCTGRSVTLVNPMQTKAALGVRKRTKEEVVEAVEVRYGVPLETYRKGEREAVCDAIGVAAAARLLSEG